MRLPVGFLVLWEELCPVLKEDTIGLRIRFEINPLLPMRRRRLSPVAAFHPPSDTLGPGELTEEEKGGRRKKELFSFFRESETRSKTAQMISRLLFSQHKSPLKIFFDEGLQLLVLYRTTTD